MTIYEKLAEAREQFHSLELKKTGKNAFAGYSYFELGDFLVPAMKCLKDAGLTTLPVSFTAETAILTLVDMTDGAVIQFTSPMAEANLKGCHPIQNLGAVQTYQRRYLWVSLMEIVEHDALDGGEGQVADKAASKPSGSKKAPTPKATPSPAKKPAEKPVEAAKPAPKPAAPIPQKPVEEDFYLEDEDAAKEFAEFMNKTAREMHSGSVDVLVDFWKRNTHATDYLKEHYPSVYDNVVENFATLRKEVEGDDE